MRLCLSRNQKEEHALRHRKFLMRDITTIFSKQTNLYLCKNARVSIDVKGSRVIDLNHASNAGKVLVTNNPN